MNPDRTDEQLDRIYARQLRAIADGLAVPARTTLAVATPRAQSIAISTRTLGTVGLLVGLIAALVWTMAIVGQSPATPLTFPLGSIAFVRGGDLFVASADGTGDRIMAKGIAGDDPTSGSDQVQRFAFSPDRTALAHTRPSDAAHGAKDEVVIVDAAGAEVGTFHGSGSDADRDTIFGWSSDGLFLAVYPGESPDHVEIVRRDGTAVRFVPLGDLQVRDFDWSYLSWSPDNHWIAVPTGGDACAESTQEAPCYALLAVDGSGPMTLSDRISPAELAWARGGSFATSHWGPTDGYPGSVASVEIRDVGPNEPYTIAPLPEHIDAVAGHTLSWSPKGDSLALVTVDDRFGPVIFVMPREGPFVRVPSNPMAGVVEIPTISWSPDGERLIFATRPGDGDVMTLWSINPNGGAPTKLADANGPLFDIAGAGLSTGEATSTVDAATPTVDVRPS